MQQTHVSNAIRGVRYEDILIPICRVFAENEEN